MGVMDKFLDALHLNNEEDYDEDYYDEDDVVETRPRKTSVAKNDNYDSGDDKSKKGQQKITQMKPARRASTGMEVCVIKPTNIEDAREITETLLANRAVVLNLEGLDVGIAQRIIDFASGSTYAISGNLQKISNYIFIITPASVEVSGDFQEILSGTFNVPPITHNIL
jgi:cell division inhibitor SepF